jgi:hypothetical protein
MFYVVDIQTPNSPPNAIVRAIAKCGSLKSYEWFLTCYNTCIIQGDTRSEEVKERAFARENFLQSESSQEIDLCPFSDELVGIDDAIDEFEISGFKETIPDKSALTVEDLANADVQISMVDNIYWTIKSRELDIINELIENIEKSIQGAKIRR